MTTDRLRWPGPPIHVIGLGACPGAPLSEEAHAVLREAEVLIGATRHLAAFPHLAAERCVYPSPLVGLWALLEGHAGRRVVVLASGDPLLYGIGAFLIRRLAPEQLLFHPNVSSIQAAFARLQRPWQQAHIVSLHGCPLASLRAVLQANRLYAVLTDPASTPIAIARLLVENGFGDSKVWVAEELETQHERLRCFRAGALAEAEAAFSPLNVVIVETRGPGGVLPEFPGIPDERFVTHDEPGRGMLSKREVRVNILSLLAPRAREVGWDVGAGCGGVSVEWARWNPQGSVYAVERHGGRLACIEANRERFGVVQNLHIRPGEAPQALAELPDPDAVFVGGSHGALGILLEAAWRRLRPGGRLVASAVTEDSRIELYAFAADRPAEFTEIRVARGDYLAGQRLLRPQLPVLLMKLERSRS